VVADAKRVGHRRQGRVHRAILMIAVVLMIAQAIAINRLAMIPYPWWAPLEASTRRSTG